MFVIFELKEGQTMFLVRSAFWLSVVILLLPAENGEPNDKLSATQTNVTAGEALVAAQTTVGDLSGFCQRNQITCETGKAAVDTFIRKAQYGASLLNNWVSGGSPANASSVKPADRSAYIEPVTNKKVKITAKTRQQIQLADKARASQQTLTKEDLSPSWGGPKIKRKA
jgi:hypothetical protein